MVLSPAIDRQLQAVSMETSNTSKHQLGTACGPHDGLSDNCSSDAGLASETAMSTRRFLLSEAGFKLLTA